jgi:hypothetical protein
MTPFSIFAALGSLTSLLYILSLAMNLGGALDSLKRYPFWLRPILVTGTVIACFLCPPWYIAMFLSVLFKKR